jgi:hypothetical protein
MVWEMQNLEELIAACQMKAGRCPDVQQLEETWRLYSEAGFDLKARGLKRNLLLVEAGQRMGATILFKRPSFHVSIHNFARYPLETLDDSVERSGAKSWVYEVEPSVFKGTVPATILTTMLEAKKLGFKPYVWFVSSDAEVHKFLNQPLTRADPALVAYPIVARVAGTEVVDNEFGIVLGLWGKDIEEINGILRTNSATTQ